MTKYRKNEVLIRNDGVYVISGIFCGAHGGRRLWRKQAEVSPVSNKSHKHALRAMWIDDCELWVKMHSRPGRWPLEAAKRLEARAHAVRSAGTLGRLRRHSAKTSGRVILVDKPKVCQRSESEDGACHKARTAQACPRAGARVHWPCCARGFLHAIVLKLCMELRQCTIA